jgi:hypothetical protein
MGMESLLARAATRGFLIGCALLSPVANAAGEIHRCLDGGRVTYTDRGCMDQGEVVAIASVASVSATGRGEAASHGRATPVSLGMSPRMVFDAMGRPLETIATLEGRMLVEYWVYRSIDGATRIAFQDGRVTRIHTR